jgi:hypothetical protein
MRTSGKILNYSVVPLGIRIFEVLVTVPLKIYTSLKKNAALVAPLMALTNETITVACSTTFLLATEVSDLDYS